MDKLNIPRLDEFVALAKGKNFARTDRFMVNFSAPPKMGVNSITQRDMSLLCEEATFPGKIIKTRSLRINALSEQRAHTADYMNQSIKFQFLVDATWQSRIFFETWMNYIIDPIQNDGRGNFGSREVGFYKDYIGNIDIYSVVPIFNESSGNVERPVFGISLKEAWPIAISPQPMSSSSQGLHRLNVTFTFKWWENQYDQFGFQSYTPIRTTIVGTQK